ncbi:hypothetical protein EV356DRAFT_536888 [Viridothelium virens]|uniref:Uncharacterized protein n=1 Tax=Viridothelium virens TaxID=1048519 RepID=A0A6A6GVQ4_VIRVR|nr:hypothetical protein EV356DRAFT_536888 [Viridothelium virens]
MQPTVSYNLHTDVELPPCEGPKLKRFRNPVGNICFKRLLSSSTETSSDSSSSTASSISGGHGHVFEVEIDGESFALKIFKFVPINKARRSFGPAFRRRVDDYLLTYHSDPFFAECRAYGRINEERASKGWKGRDFAARCHGFIALPAATYEDILVDQFGITDWSRDKEDRQVSKAERQPFRALVKTLVETPITIKNPPTMLRDLKKLRSLGVFQRDIYARNYKDGLLVDFSLAWTKPHWHWDLLNTKEKEKMSMIKTMFAIQTSSSRTASYPPALLPSTAVGTSNSLAYLTGSPPSSASPFSFLLNHWFRIVPEIPPILKDPSAEWVRSSLRSSMRVALEAMGSIEGDEALFLL